MVSCLYFTCRPRQHLFMQSSAGYAGLACVFRKPLAIRHAVETFKIAIWLDAGCTVTTPLRTSLFPILRKNGHFAVQGQDGNMVQWCHDGTWNYYNLNKSQFVNKPSYAGGINGWMDKSPEYYSILVPWTQCALREECIAPPGSSLANHRYDQSALSIIIYTSNVSIHEHTEQHHWMPRPKCFERQPYAVWTSRGSENCYAKLAGTCEAATKTHAPWLAEPMYHP